MQRKRREGAENEHKEKEKKIEPWCQGSGGINNLEREGFEREMNRQKIGNARQ